MGSFVCVKYIILGEVWGSKTRLNQTIVKSLNDS